MWEEEKQKYSHMVRRKKVFSSKIVPIYLPIRLFETLMGRNEKKGRKFFHPMCGKIVPVGRNRHFHIKSEYKRKHAGVILEVM